MTVELIILINDLTGILTIYIDLNHCVATYINLRCLIAHHDIAQI